MATVPASGAATQNECSIFEKTPTVVARVNFGADSDWYDLVKTFEPIGGGLEERYALLDIDKKNFEQLRVMGLVRGWTVAIDEAATAKYHTDLTRAAKGLSTQSILGEQTISGYSCYRTVEESYTAGRNIATNYPNLATWRTFGQSWLKTKGRGGYDLYELVLTNKNKGGTKPKALITGALHAREYATGELATRFAEYLVSQYGKDADVTWLLDSQEVHIVFQMNPDGRKKAETGAMWRKNVNDTLACSNGLYGVDMNRNHSFRWGGPGASTDPCDETFRGPSSASEPEVKSEEALFRSLWAERRGTGTTDAAPADTSGIYIDIHSYGGMVLWPYGDTSSLAPNSAQLQSLGRKLSYFNGYEPDQSAGLYPAAGGSDDAAYGELGVAAYTIEVGNAFFESCANFTSTTLPKNQAALLYALKVARAPYQLGSGPDIVTPTATVSSSSVTLSAKADGTRFNNTNGTETTYPIVSAEYFVDVAPWDGGVAKPMTAADGSMNSTVENVTASLGTAGLSVGQHTVYVRAKNSKGNYGPVSALFVNVGSTTTTPTPAPGSTTYTGSVASRAYSYQPSTSGFSYAGGTLGGKLSATSSTDFDLYLQKLSTTGTWTTVAKSENSTSTESVSYNAASGTYRWAVYAYTGSGNYTLTVTK